MTSPASPSPLQPPQPQPPPNHGLEQDEYPSSPTLKYFMAKSLIALISIGVLWAVWMAQPNTCEGMCGGLPMYDAVTRRHDQQQSSSCEKVDAAVMYFQTFTDTGASEVIHMIRHKAKRRKGFNMKSLKHNNVPQTDPRTVMLAALDPDSIPVPSKPQLEKYLHQYVTRAVTSQGMFERLQSNRTFIDGVIPPNASTLLSSSVVVFSMLLHPHQRLQNMYDGLRNRNVHGELIMKPFLRQYGNLTFAACLEDPQCVVNNDLERWGSMYTRTFCGFQLHEACESSSQDEESMLGRAKQYLQAHVEFVGLMEDLSTSFQYLERRFPTYFEFLGGAGTTNVEDTVCAMNVTAPPPVIVKLSDEAIRTLNRITAMDMKLYEFVKVRFTEQVQGCGLNDNHGGGSGGSVFSWLW